MVEVSPTEPPYQWRKSRASGGQNCVEVAVAADAVLVRDSKDPAGAVLVYTRAEWAAFLAGARDGEFDLPGA